METPFGLQNKCARNFRPPNMSKSKRPYVQSKSVMKGYKVFKVRVRLLWNGNNSELMPL